LAYISNILINCKLYNRGGIATLPPPLRALWQAYSDCGLQTSAGIRDWAKFMSTSIR